ncbi:hypothetical protein [Absidia glauca]|uniref:Uncharacterized protein n=1 Tax=Absidia glauca TaxID=4829 RepID=A0A163J066_ABSGL|nr:hypothetical protein [Absidia glauca]
MVNLSCCVSCHSPIQFVNQVRLAYAAIQPHRRPPLTVSYIEDVAPILDNHRAPQESRNHKRAKQHKASKQAERHHPYKQNQQQGKAKTINNKSFNP